MKALKSHMIYILVGAVSFWAPDALIKWIFMPWSNFEISLGLLTFLVPVIVGITWFWFAKMNPQLLYPVGLPIFMLLGIWMLGPLAMALSHIPLGGTILDQENIGDFVIIWLFFPLSTISMATYSGSLGGVFVATLVLLVAAVISGIRYCASTNKKV